MKQAPAVYSIPDSLYFGDLIASALGADNPGLAWKTFAGGEQYYRLAVPDVDDPMSLAGRNVVVVGSMHTDSNLLGMYRLGCQLADLGTRQRIFVIPFLGYSTMDQAKFTGEVVTAKWVIHQLSTIPKPNGNCFLFIDLHSAALIHFFEGDSTRFELSAERVLMEAVLDLEIGSAVLASADMGRAKQVRALAKKWPFDAVAFVEKTRTPGKTEVLEVFGDVNGKTVVIYDDMIRSAGTMLDAANAYLERGAAAVYAVASHLALDNAEIAIKLADSPLAKVIATNSHPMSRHRLVVERRDKFVIRSVAHVFTAAIRKVLGL